MKTFFIDLDGLSQETFKELMGFILTIGLNFRKIDQKTESKTGRTLVVELETKSEEKALKEFINDYGITSPIIIGNDFKASFEGKNIGVLKQVNQTDGNYYLDNTTGKKFNIVRNQ